MINHGLNDGKIANGDLPLTVSVEEAALFVKRRAGELVNELINQKGRAEPPFLSKELARLYGIKDIKETDLGNLSALLIKCPEGYIIKLNKYHHPTRQNFSIAHEIGHTFLHELNKPIDIGSNEFRSTSAGYIKKVKEHLCDIAAAELLMPENIFKKYIAGFGISLNSIERLATTFRVSIQAAAIRVSQVSTEPCYVILWKQCKRPRSKGFSGYFMRNKIYLRNPSPVSRAFESDKVVKARKTFQISASNKEQFEMKSKAFGLGETRYVISLVFPQGQ